MIRNILCKACGEKQEPHPEDTANGWLSRKVRLTSKKPEDRVITQIAFQHGVRTEVKRTELDSLVCDTCNEPIRCNYHVGHQPRK